MGRTGRCKEGKQEGAGKEKVGDLDSLLDELDKRLEVKLREQEERIVNGLEKKINTSLEYMEGNIEDLQKENKALKEEIRKLEEKCAKQDSQMQRMKREVEAVKEHAVRNEQYSRKNNLKIFGLKEKTGEDCMEEIQKMAKERLKVNIQREEMEIAHRLPAAKGPRPVIVKFRDTGSKFTLLKARKVLKGTGVSIAEDISQTILDTVKMLRDNENTKDTWCWNGKIYVKDKDDRVHKYSYGSAIPDIFLAKGK